MKKATKNLNIYAKRLGELIRDNNYTHETVANAVGVTRQGVGKWVNGDSLPDVLMAAKVADFFGVSLDYLSGNGSVRSTDTDLRAVCDYTGLSEKNIMLLEKLREKKELYKRNSKFLDTEYGKRIEYIDVISAMLETLDSYAALLDNIRFAASVNLNEDFTEDIENELMDIDEENETPEGEGIYDRIYKNGKILSGYFYKRYLVQSAHDEGRLFIQEIINRLTPPENLYRDEKGNIVDVNMDTQHEKRMLGLYDEARMNSDLLYGACFRFEPRKNDKEEEE